MPSVAPNPQVLGAVVAVKDEATLALLDITGMTLGTPVYVSGTDTFFSLKVSSASLVAGQVVAVAGSTGLRWLLGGSANASFGADTLVKLPNASGTLVTALEMITALTVNTAAAEASATTFKNLAAGAQQTSLTLDGQGVALPDGTLAAPSLSFASEAGRNTGFYFAGNSVWGYGVDGQNLAFFGDLNFGFRWFIRMQESRSADVASGGTVTMGAANFAQLTGTTAVNFITTTSWIDGARIELYVPSGVTFNQNTGSPPGATFALQLKSGANTAIAAGSSIAFRKNDAISKWVQVA